MIKLKTVALVCAAFAAFAMASAQTTAAPKKPATRRTVTAPAKPLRPAVRYWSKASVQRFPHRLNQ